MDGAHPSPHKHCGMTESLPDRHNPPTPRQLVLISDGTNMNFSGGVEDSNAVKLLEWLTRHPDSQRLVCYDPGVGHPKTLHSVTWWDHLSDLKERIAGLAFGMGVQENVAQLYGWLVARWQPGDQIFLFGFSRGAFTVRSVAGLINRYGLVLPEHVEMLPTLVSAYFSEDASPEPAALAESRSKQPLRRHGGGAVATQLRQLLAPGPRADVPVQFVGVWDTVASVGMPGLSATFTAKPDVEHKAFIHLQQARAVHEFRCMFDLRPYRCRGVDADADCFESGLPDPDGRSQGSLTQRWFAGDHCGVGGGRLSSHRDRAETTLAWMLQGGIKAGLRAGAPTAGSAPPSPDDPVLTEVAANPIWALLGLQLRKGVGCAPLAAREARLRGLRAWRTVRWLIPLLLGALPLTVLAWSASLDPDLCVLQSIAMWLDWQLGAPLAVHDPPSAPALHPVAATAFQATFLILALIAGCVPLAWAFLTLAPLGLADVASRKALNVLGRSLPCGLWGTAGVAAGALAHLAGTALAQPYVEALPTSVKAQAFWTLGSALSDTALMVIWVGLASLAAACVGTLALVAWALAVRLRRLGKVG
jgi:uncharacterized protein (DUF2235 family)